MGFRMELYATLHESSHSHSHKLQRLDFCVYIVLTMKPLIRSQAKDFGNRLLGWYDANKRDLPWRHASNFQTHAVCAIAYRMSKACIEIDRYFRIREYAYCMLRCVFKR